ncbi:acyl-CoA reductase [Cesiribacter sp. SM1]|uniref:acyl-CoA reductase n=1 Tax=Cesiribacter sp. SM1 TaxID=2861196 RepID=UPI001CD251CC|nr:acyl-CoA reductase [Cesiribacter sp. SM1]
MKLADRIQAFVSLGTYLQELTAEEADRLSRLAQGRNGWFTPSNVRFALKAWASLLQPQNINKWLEAYNIPDEQEAPKHVGLVMAGNIPLVGFHDMLCVLISGHNLHAKPSSSDPLPEVLSKKLLEIEPRFASHIEFQEQLKHMDAYIATGSDNTYRYFEYYFRNTPSIIRKNRSSCALLTGNESADELKALGRDMLQYWGLGCRSVNKLFVPEEYDFPTLFRSLEVWSDVQNHHKWSNNYDYYKSIFLVNGEQHLDTGFLLFKEAEAFASPVSVVYYQYYRDLQEAEKLVEEHREKLQCIVGQESTPASTAFGQAQRPQLWDYADGIDTLAFLLKL